MKRAVFPVLLLLMVPAFGQTEEPESNETTARAEATRPSEPSVAERFRERIRRAIRLPRTAEDSREEGVPEERVREVLRTSRERRIPAGDAQEILEAENEAIRAGADKDNFGAAVRSMKESGLRGRELAEAIHAEQIARGMKKSKDKVRHRANDEDDDEGRGMGRGKGRGKAKEGGDR